MKKRKSSKSVKKLGSASFKALLDKERKLLKPSRDKLPVAEKLIGEIEKLLVKAGIHATVVPGGSYAKGTMLKDKFDIDLFVRFDFKKYRDEDLSLLLQKALKSLKAEKVHGSRDYFQIRRSGIVFEIIPVLRIDSFKEALNVTDMSPLHVGYVKSKFTKGKNLADDIRLAKQFCRGAGVYGAESYIRGFSGHVVDLLIIYYGGFENLLMQASVWGEKVVIDLEAHWKDPLTSLNSSKLDSPLVIVDPIQKDRNAAAAVSVDKFEDFKDAAKRFIMHPSIDFFKVKSLTIKDMKDLTGNDTLVVLEALPTEGKDDVVGTKILKCHEFIQKMIEKNEFILLHADWEYGKKSTLFYIVRDEVLSPELLVKGPPVKSVFFCESFKAAHKKTVQKNGFLYAIEKRKFTDVVSLIKSTLKDKYVSERVKKIRVIYP
jgi:tRNA nucleotidyltransferase (CCA-adding enzyme)